MRAATVVQVLQDLFYVLLHVLFYFWSLLNVSSARRRYMYHRYRISQNFTQLKSMMKQFNNTRSNVRDIVTKTTPSGTYAYNIHV